MQEKKSQKISFYYDILLCLGKPRDFRNTLLELTIYFNTMAEFMVNVKKLILFPYKQYFSSYGNKKT